MKEQDAFSLTQVLIIVIIIVLGIIIFFILPKGHKEGKMSEEEKAIKTLSETWKGAEFIGPPKTEQEKTEFEKEIKQMPGVTVDE